MLKLIVADLLFIFLIVFTYFNFEYKQIGTILSFFYGVYLAICLELGEPHLKKIFLFLLNPFLSGAVALLLVELIRG